jgi:hypothetical protein
MDEEAQAAELAAAKQQDKNKIPEDKSPLGKLSKNATGNFLKQCWLNIIPSFGLTILGIDALYFAWMVIPSRFCKPGHEWVPEELAKTSPAAAKETGDKIALVENGGCCCMNAILALALLFTIVMIYYIIFPGAFTWDAVTTVVGK